MSDDFFPFEDSSLNSGLIKLKRILYKKELGINERRAIILNYVQRIGLDRFKEILVAFLMTRDIRLNDFLKYVGEVLKMASKIKFKYIYYFLVMASKIESFQKM